MLILTILMNLIGCMLCSYIGAYEPKYSKRVFLIFGIASMMVIQMMILALHTHFPQLL